LYSGFAQEPKNTEKHIIIKKHFFISSGLSCVVLKTTTKSNLGSYYSKFFVCNIMETFYCIIKQENEDFLNIFYEYYGK